MGYSSKEEIESSRSDNVIEQNKEGFPGSRRKAAKRGSKRQPPNSTIFGSIPWAGDRDLIPKNPFPRDVFWVRSCGDQAAYWEKGGSIYQIDMATVSAGS